MLILILILKCYFYLNKLKCNIMFMLFWIRGSSCDAYEEYGVIPPASCWFLARHSLRPGRWRRYVSPKRRDF
jgi:hypothetical protein